MTPDETFNLGAEGGDAENLLTGSLTGTLNADTIYELRYTAIHRYIVRVHCRG